MMKNKENSKKTDRKKSCAMPKSCPMPEEKSPEQEKNFSMSGMMPNAGGLLMNIGKGLFNPKFEMTEDKNQIRLCAELPGLTEKDMSVSLEGPLLTIRGMKKSEHVSRDESCRFSEFSYGAFSRSFALPATFDPHKVKAEFAKGVLTLTIPKDAVREKDDKMIKIHSASR